MKSRKLVYMDAKSSKFWNIELEGTKHFVTYGRIGTAGQSTAKEFDSPAKAEAAYDKLVNEKLSKGYVDAEGSGVSAKGATEGDGELLPAIAFHSILKTDEIRENVKTFIGQRVADYHPDKAGKYVGQTIFRFRCGWDDEAVPIPTALRHFLGTAEAVAAIGLVIGNWGGDDSSDNPTEIINILVENKDRLPKLVALYFGDIVSEENEISWIHQSDLSPLLEAFPRLQLLRARGGTDLSFSKPSHPTLRALALETGGLSVDVVRSICTSDFPNLEHLELWLGTDEYGGDSTVQDLQPILSGKLFPKLKYLGLRNCQYADEIAGVVVNSPIIERIETLDLSLGVITDVGAKALLNIPQSGSLKKVNLHHNFISAKLAKELKALKVTFDTSKDKSSGDEDEDAGEDEWRFVAVGE